MVPGDEGAPNGGSGQGTDGTNGKDGAGSNADLTEWRDLSNQCRGKANGSTGGETEQRGKDQLSGVVVRGDVDGEDEDDGQKTENGHDIEATDLVSEDARQGSSKDGAGVENRDEVLRQLQRHATAVGDDGDKGEDWKHAKEEEEDGEGEEEHGGFGERKDKGHEFEWSFDWGDADSDGGDAEEAESQDKEGAGAHGPAERGLSEHATDDDGENDTAQGTAGGGNANRHSSLLEEPRRERADGSGEDAGGSDG